MGAPPPQPPASGAVSARGLGRNLSASFVFFFLSVVVGVLYTPFMVSRLGIEVYGLVPLANSVLTYLTVLTTGISAAVGRFVTVDFARQDIPAANRTFNTFFFLGLIIIAVLGLAALPLIPYSTRFFRVPQGQEAPFFRLLGALLFATLVSMQITCFDSAMWVRNRFDLRSVIETAGLAVRVGVVVICFLWVDSRLDWITLAIVAAVLVVFAGNILVWRRLTPELHLSPRLFDASRLPAILDTGRWLFLTQAGALFTAHVDLVLVNISAGPLAGGNYAAILQWSNLLRAVCTQSSLLLAPSFAVQHATQNVEALVRLSFRAVRLLGLLIALPVGLLAGLGGPLLGTWLGPSFAPLAPLAALVLLPLAMEGAHLPLSPVLLAVNRIRVASVMTVVIGFGHLGLGWFLAHILGWESYGVAVAAALASIVRYAIFFPIYTARVLGQPWHRYLPPILQALGVAGILALLGGAASQVLPTPSWLWLFAAGGGLAVLYSAALWFLLLNAEDRSALMALRPGARA